MNLRCGKPLLNRVCGLTCSRLGNCQKIFNHFRLLPVLKDSLTGNLAVRGGLLTERFCVKNQTPKKWATQRALAGLMAASVAFGGLAVVQTTPAFAQDAQTCSSFNARPTAGQGTLTVEQKNYKPGDVVTVKGSGFAPRGDDGYLTFKLNANALWWAENQSAGSGLERNPGPTDLRLPAPLVDGSFETQLVLPTTDIQGKPLKSGKYEIRALGAAPSQASIATEIHVLAEGDQPGTCGTLAAPAAAPQDPQPAPGAVTPLTTEAPAPAVPPVQTDNAAKVVDVQATTFGANGRGTKAGQVNVKFKLEGFPAGQDVVAKIGDSKVKFAAGRETKDSLQIGEDGTVEGTAILQPGQALEGEHTIGFRSGTENPVRAVATVQVQSAGNVTNDAAQGAKVTFTGVNLKPGSKITAVGTADTNWLAEGQNAVADDKGVVEIKDVQIPADAPFRAPVQFSYEVDGETKTRELTQRISASQATHNEQSYEIKTSETAPGLYQSAVNDKGEVFVARSDGRPPKESGSIYKLDAATLEVKAEKKLENGTPAAYGIGLDNENGLVWITNTRSDQVAVYRQDNLELVHQWDKGITTHPRDVVVDKTTGLAYVSVVDRKADAGRIDVFSAKEKKLVRSIDVPGMPSVMSMELDQTTGNLYTVSLQKPKAARINVRNNDEVQVFDLGDKVDRASGVAYVPGKDHLYVASQGSGNVVVINAKDGAFIKEVPTGAGALNAAYNAKDNRVYVTNRAAATITVIDANTHEVVANLPAGANANHVTVGPDGYVYAVNKRSRAEGVDSDQIHRYKFTGTPSDPAAAAGNTEQPGNVTPPAQGPAAGENPPAENPGAPADPKDTKQTSGSSLFKLPQSKSFDDFVKLLVGVVSFGGLAFGLGQLVKHLVHSGIIPSHLVPPYLR